MAGRVRLLSTNEKGQRNLPFALLPRQDSNLDYLDPESSVLPITPRGSVIYSPHTVECR